MEVLVNSMPHLTSIYLGRTDAREVAKQAFESRKVAMQRL